MAYTVFDLTVNDTVTIEANSSSLRGRIISGILTLGPATYTCKVLYYTPFSPHTLHTHSASLTHTSHPSGERILDLLYSYTAATGRLKPLPKWIGQGAVLGLQGGTDAVQNYINQVTKVWGNMSDIVGVWLQDWTGQRVFSGPHDLPRTGLWWNWEVCQLIRILKHTFYFDTFHFERLTVNTIHLGFI